jgi:tetratricopeptide (TPR) repeat protein
MNNDLFQRARQAARNKDYGEAIQLFRDCIHDPAAPPAPGELGRIYHQMGNCFTKMRRYDDAVEAYAQATADTAYDACGAVNSNMGMAYAAARDYENAVKHFEIAVSDNSYPTPYKAYMGMGNALLKIGKSAEAGVAFREAALDGSNPDPTKALLNLGVCFMALDRPADAVSSYESALQFDMADDVRNKMQASLGQAYVACGEMDRAVEAFEKALADKTYFLSASASVDYQRAIAAVSQGSSDATQALPALADTSGLDVVTADDSTVAESPEPDAAPDAQDPYYFADAYEEEGAEGAQDRFFNASEQELEEWSRGVARKERKRKSVGLKVLLVIILLLLAALAAGVVLYMQGYGFPTQEATVEQLFRNPGDSGVYANGVAADDVEYNQDLIPANSTIAINGVDRSTSTSTVYVTLTTAEGGKVDYSVQLVRDMIGWKVAGVDLYFASQN